MVHRELLGSGFGEAVGVYSHNGEASGKGKGQIMQTGRTQWCVIRQSFRDFGGPLFWESPYSGPVWLGTCRVDPPSCETPKCFRE